MNKRALALISAVVLAAIGGAGCSLQDAFPFQRQKSAAAQSGVDHILGRNLDELGVPKAAQDKLIKKFKRGEPWDSMKPSEVEALGESFFTVTKEEGVKRHVFPDGSVVMTRVGPVRPKPTADGQDKQTQQNSNALVNVAQSRASCGTGYCNYNRYEVFHSNGAISGKFHVNFSLVHGKEHEDQISDAYDPLLTIVGGTYSNPHLEVGMGQEDRYAGGSPAPAFARLSFSYQLVDQTLSGDYTITFYAGQDSYYTDSQK